MADIISINSDEYAVQDMHSQYVCHVPREEAQRLLKLGFASTYGTKKKIHGVRLNVPVSVATDTGDTTGAKSHHIANLGGTRFLFRQKLATETCNAFVYRHKKMDTTESPEHALLRILTPPALESSVYTPRFKATEQERANDPGRARRKKVVEIFSFGRPTPPTPAVAMRPAA